jgi:hypothetical protein
LALHLGECALERTLALGERRLLLRELCCDFRAVAVGVRQLAEFDRDLPLALGSPRLCGRHLGLQLGQPLLLDRSRRRALPELLLLLLEFCLLGCQLRGSLVDLG